jgi:hypothetical protein
MICRARACHELLWRKVCTVQSKYIPALRLGCRHDEQVIRVMTGSKVAGQSIERFFRLVSFFEPLTIPVPPLLAPSGRLVLA